jgi:hypothetical protein
MACIDAPTPPFPTLPGKLLDFSPAPIPPIVVAGPVLDALAILLASLNAYFDAIPFTCPREAGP